MKVLKFGTSALSTSDKIKVVAKLASKTTNSIVIVSAIAGTTDKLEEISDYLYKKNPEGAIEGINILEKEYTEKIEELFSSASAKEEAKTFVKEKINYIRSFTKDLFTLFEEKIILAQGEILSSGLLTLLIKEQNSDVREISALDFMQIDKKGEPDTTFIQDNLNKILQANKPDIYVTQGYICRNAYGEIDNFQFGGSDYSASLIGAAVQAEEIQIWTDKDVMYGDNSQLISNSHIVHQINFDEAAELAYFGAKILHPMCILPAKIANIPVRLLNIHSPEDQGTVISNETEKGKIKAVAAKDGITTINIKSSRMLLAHGFLRKIGEIFEKHQTSIDMMTTSEVGVSVTIDNIQYLTEITDDLKRLGIVTVEKNMTIISVVGDLDQETDSPISKVFEVLKSIPVKMVSFGGSNNNISFIIKSEQKEKTLQILNKTIF
ncbi:MAG: aspartate kinase [Dysgonomonas sp.]|nr:aspartate kinase [Dysgonomonas sp.]